MKLTSNRLALRPSIVPLAAVLVAAVLVLVLPSHGFGMIIRSVVFVVLILPMPGLVLMRWSEPEADGLAILAGSVVLSAALLAFTGFILTNWLSVRWTSNVILLVVVVITVLGSVNSIRFEAPLLHRSAYIFALALALSLGATATAVHLSFPPSPVEASFSLTSSDGTVTSIGVSVHVAISSVGGLIPRWLELSEDGTILSTTLIMRGEHEVTLTGAPKLPDTSCPSQIEVTASNGSFLTPIFTCQRLT